MTALILVPFIFIQLELRIFLVGYLMCSYGVLCAITLMCLHPLGQGTFHITANCLSTAIRGSELQAQFSFFPGLDPVRTFQLGGLSFNPGVLYLSWVILFCTCGFDYSFQQGILLKPAPI
jgi:hypothetical protein